MSLELPNVTLCCIDTRFPELAEYSIHRSTERAGVRFGEVILFTSSARAAFPRRFETALRVVAIPDIASKIAYSQFVISELPSLVDSDYVLITQWDSFVLSKMAWRPSFLDFDYIGAAWPFLPPPYQVGNGGFSLRSRRLLVAARQHIEDVDENEDFLICVRHRAELVKNYGLQFADIDHARAFAFERLPPDGIAFGFHGLFNFDRTLPRTELNDYLEAMPDVLVDMIEGAELATRLCDSGEKEMARLIARKRLLRNPRDPQTQRLAVKLWSRNQPCWCGSGSAFKRCHGYFGDTGREPSASAVAARNSVA